MLGLRLSVGIKKERRVLHVKVFLLLRNDWFSPFVWLVLLGFALDFHAFF